MALMIQRMLNDRPASTYLAASFLTLAILAVGILAAFGLPSGSMTGSAVLSEQPVVVLPEAATTAVMMVVPADDESSTLQQDVSRLQSLSQEELKAEYDKHLQQWRDQFVLLVQGYRAFNADREENSGRWAHQFRTAKRRADEARKQAGLAAVFLAQKQGNLDPELASMVANSMREYLHFEKYHMAYEAGKALVESGVREPSILARLGYAAWCNNRFSEAKELFAEAVVAGYELPPEYAAIRAQLDEAVLDLEREKELDANSGELPQARIVTTKGTLTIELFEDQAPNTVANFIYLAEKDFFNGQQFFDTSKQYVTTGSSTNTAAGNAGYEIKAEYQREDRRPHLRGCLTLMVIEVTGNGSSQFSILTQPMAELTSTKNTVFARVVEGDVVLDDLARVGEEWKEQAKNTNFVLPEPDKILSVEILKKRDHDYEPEMLRIGF